MTEKRPEKRASGSLPRLSPDSSAGPQRGLPALRGPSFLAPGTLFARRYRIEQRIGAGGMGVVYGAVEAATCVQVAIKVLSASAATPQNVRRFRREGQTAAAVVNARCCRILGVGMEGASPYIVMERLEGETLRRRLSETGPLSAVDAVSVMLQLLEGLTAAHAVGVLHRDIKPGNIFITTPRGAAPSIKIIDFGLAKLLPATAWRPRASMPPEDMSAITTTDVVPGTPMYLAPEQINGQRDLDQRVDVWAAGLTFREMLLNLRAFSGASFVALAHDIVLTNLPSVSAQRADLPAGFDRIFVKALAKHRDHRFATAAQFREALLDEWSRFRTAAVIRGEQLRNPRAPEPEIDGEQSDTEINVTIHFDPDGPG